MKCMWITSSIGVLSSQSLLCCLVSLLWQFPCTIHVTNEDAQTFWVQVRSEVTYIFCAFLWLGISLPALEDAWWWTHSQSQTHPEDTGEEGGREGGRKWLLNFLHHLQHATQNCTHTMPTHLKMVTGPKFEPQSLWQPACQRGEREELIGYAPRYYHDNSSQKIIPIPLMETTDLLWLRDQGIL